MFFARYTEQTMVCAHPQKAHAQPKSIL